MCCITNIRAYHTYRMSCRVWHTHVSHQPIRHTHVSHQPIRHTHVSHQQISEHTIRTACPVVYARCRVYKIQVIYAVLTTNPFSKNSRTCNIRTISSHTHSDSYIFTQGSCHICPTDHELSHTCILVTNYAIYVSLVTNYAIYALLVTNYAIHAY